MGNADARHRAAKAAALARWGNQVVSRAVGVVQERADELSPEQLADLRQIADGREALAHE